MVVVLLLLLEEGSGYWEEVVGYGDKAGKARSVADAREAPK